MDSAPLRGALLRLPHHPDDAVPVEDQADAAVAHDGASSHAPDGAEGVAERLDHHFLFSNQLVDQQRHTVAFIVDDDDGAFPGVGDGAVDVCQSIRIGPPA